MKRESIWALKIGISRGMILRLGWDKLRAISKNASVARGDYPIFLRNLKTYLWLS